MRLSRYALGVLSALVVSAIADDAVLSAPSLSRRDGDHHMSHGPPLLELNETELTLHHQPIPESYYTIDFDDSEHASERHPGLMFLHATAMALAWFVMLPAGIAMRSVNHAWHKMVVIALPNMYEGQVHGKQGYTWILFALILTTIDFLNIFRRVYLFFRNGQKFDFRSFWSSVVLDKGISSSFGGAEYAGLVSEEPEEMDVTMEMVSPTSPTAQWANDVRRHHRDYSQSAASETTLFGRSHFEEESSSNRRPAKKVPLSRRIGTGVFATLERVLVFGGLMQVLSGIVVYTGGCRENYLNGCLAHIIKGAIFWCYGLVSFARYLGAFAELGWAWNRAPAAGYPSAEFVESLVIFIYGITNTWMERWGARPGDPFTTKQIQHIGIAVMFWFAGLLGMAIESKTVRQWLASSTISALNPSQRDQEAVAEPPTYIASFNPFPALVVGVTGAAMAAHAQTYLFQVQIHQLWGNLLLAWSVLRCLTYFFLWLGVPRSMLPSRPPTEALGSFFLACGGLAFIFSTEELTIAAMRRGRDDVMMFLNVAVAITCFALCWTIAVVGFKGYLKSRIAPPVAYHSSA